MKIVKLKRAVLATAAVGALLTAAACSGGGAEETEPDTSGGGGGDSGYTFAMVTHEVPGDTFWDRMRVGDEQAGTDAGSGLR